MADAVYVLCAVTSLAAATLLARAYLRSRARLLLFSSLAFVGLAANNVGLVVDFLVLPDENFAVLRTIPAVVGMFVLVIALAWEEP